MGGMSRLYALVLPFLLLPLAAVAGADLSGRVRVVDADTWEVGRVRVRLFGIDAPELDQTCRWPDGREWACGRWASDEARRRFGGRRAECEAVDIDRYGRVVARCLVDGRDAGRELVAEGIAFAYRRYSMDYDLDEKGAAINGRGLHGAQVQSPAEFRRARRAARRAAGRPDPAAPGGCVIKGNISSSGARIYHLPGQENYAATRIDPRRGERWFCSESEARAAGWRRARR